jgi:hypothetical protein
MLNKIIFITILTVLFVFLPELVFARDVIQSLRATENKASQILMSLGPIALIASAAAFQFSKQMGTTMLVGSCVGIMIFAGRQGIFDLIFNIFR